MITNFCQWRKPWYHFEDCSAFLSTRSSNLDSHQTFYFYETYGNQKVDRCNIDDVWRSIMGSLHPAMPLRWKVIWETIFTECSQWNPLFKSWHSIEWPIYFLRYQFGDRRFPSLNGNFLLVYWEIIKMFIELVKFYRVFPLFNPFWRL